MPNFRPVSLTPTKNRQTVAVMPNLLIEKRGSERSLLIEKTRAKIE
jgi:hypothetical protein